MTDPTDLIARLRFELRDWKPSDRQHFPSVNALVIAEAATALEALSAREMVLRGALERIANDWGYCGTCGALAKGHTDSCCRLPMWAPDDAHELARTALAEGGAK